MYAVILAGGGGTRLWPLSRPDRPKPFLPLLGDRSLLQMTADRIIAPDLLDRDDVFVVTDGRYAPLVRSQLDLPPDNLCVEPDGRNTAPAVALAVAAIERPDDEVMLVLPADHSIDKVGMFQAVLHGVGAGLAPGEFGVDQPLVTMGIQASRADTNYGYIRPRVGEGKEISIPWGSRDSVRLMAYPVQAFEEKPDLDRAEALYRMGGVAWNAGMFAWKRSAIRAAFLRNKRARRIFAPIAEGVRRGGAGLEQAYKRVEPTSVDYAVMEPASRAGLVLMASMEVGWSDLGSWSALLKALPGTGGPIRGGRVVPPGEIISLEPDDLLVHSDGGQLFLTRGPRSGIKLDSHAALLAGASHRAGDVEALLARVSTREMSA